MLPDLDSLASAEVPTALTSLVVKGSVDPLAVARAANGSWDEVTYFRSVDGEELVGLGRAWSTTGDGVNSLFETAAGDFMGAGFSEDVRALVGFAFQPSNRLSEDWAAFPNLELVVPQVLVRRINDQSTIVVTLKAGADPAEVL